MAPLPDIGVAVADILPFPRPITEEPPERKCWADEELELAAEIYAVCKGRDCRAVAAALANVIGNLGINLMPPKPLELLVRRPSDPEHCFEG